MPSKAIKIGALLLTGALPLASFLTFAAAPEAHAAVASWQKGADVVPTSTTDYASNSFQQSLQNLKNDGATYVGLVVPYYQSNINSTDIGPGWNTPTDAALASAIDYAHSIGLAVALNMHVDPYDGNWRAMINPSDRAGWFQNYGSNLLHIAGIGQAHHAEMIVIGSELVDMATYQQNSDNTGRWQSLISQLRGIYSGKLTYDANSDNNASGGVFQDEKDYIGFWGQLDYAGLSAYYNLNTSSNDVASLEAQWDYWNNADVKNFAQNVGKPILFIEVGYRSVDNAHTQPWNWSMSGNVNQTEQANDYQALLSYWNNYSYIAGVYFWYWETNPSAGGNTTTYTPQNKQAEQILKQWFTNGSGGGGGGQYSFSATGNASPSTASVGNSVNLSTTINNMGNTLGSGIVDIEVYDQSNNRAFQQFFSGVNIASGSSQNFSANWTPNTSGNYRMTVGVFSSGWSQDYYWNDTAASIPVGGSGGGGGGSGPLDIWWPTDGAHVTGTQPFKAMVENINTSQYRMFWQVGGGQLNEMFNSTTDYPHKEALVDLSGWHWSGAGPYPITFVATQNDGSTVIIKKGINIWTQ